MVKALGNSNKTAAVLKGVLPLRQADALARGFAVSEEKGLKDALQAYLWSYLQRGHTHRKWTQEMPYTQMAP